MGREGELRAALSEPVRQPQVSDVGGFPVGQRAVVRLDVSALDQANMDASLDEPLQVVWRTAEVGLGRGPEPAGQPPAGDGFDAGEHGVGTAVILGSHLDAPAS